MGYCNRGLRTWFAREGLDWKAFLIRGIDADSLRYTKNAMVERVLAHAEREAHGQQ